MTIELEPPADLPATFQRMPPQDRLAEQCVLGGMLLSAEAIADVAEILKGPDFYVPIHATLWASILDLYSRGEPVDPITLTDLLRRTGELERCGGPSYIHQLVNTPPTASNAEYYARIVKQKAILRKLAAAGSRITQMAYDGCDEAHALADMAQSELSAAVDVTESQQARRIGDGIAEFLDWLESKEQAMGVRTGLRDLDELLHGLHPGQMVVVAARPAMGKALALDTPLPTPTGWTTMGDVQVGDYLLGADGMPTRVVAATDVMLGRPCFEVEFSDGTVIVADADHQWLTETRRARRGTPGAVASIVTTKEIAETVRCATAERRPNHSVTVAAAAQLPDADLPLGPYTLGAWLGDGTTRAARITTPDPEVIAGIEAEGYRTCQHDELTHGIYLPLRPALPKRNCVVCGVEFQPRTSEVRSCGQSCGGKAKAVSASVPKPTCPDCGGPFSGTNGMCRACRADHGTVQALLRKIGVLGDKHIPAAYLRASEAQRRALLAGLLDTDGYCVKGTGTVQFSVVNERLARDTLELVLSLGYKASLSSKPARLYGKDCGTAWAVTFTPADRVFRLPRKGDRQRDRVSPTSRRRFIVDVRPVPSVPVRCVQVDNVDHLYLAGQTWIPTHNSTLALDFARSCCFEQELGAAYFSLEMSRLEIQMRAASAQGKIGLHKMRGRTMTDDDWSKLAQKIPEIEAAPLFIDDSAELTMAQVKAKARRLKRQHDIRLVVIDYLQLMQSGMGRRPESRQLEVSDMSRNTKLLAKELEVPVVVLSQLNRGPEQRQDKKPAMSDLRESGSIEQDADVVILLHREDAYDKDSPRSGEADLIVAKHRNGPTATVTVAFQGHYSRFVDMAEE